MRVPHADRFSLVLVVLAFASQVSAQVQFGSATYTTPGVGATCPMTLTIGSQPNQALIVGVHTGSAVVSSVTGAGATWASTAAITRASASNRVEIWVGTNPSAGVQTVTVTVAATDNNIICGAANFHGVNQVTPTTHAAGSSGSGGTAQVAVTSAVNNMTFALVSHNGFLATPTECTTSTDWSTNPNTQTGQGTHCAGAATTTFRWAATSNWSVAGIDIQAAGAGGGPLWSGILDPSRAIDWRTINPGVEGGIPNRTTVCRTLSPGATPAQTAQAISDAITACSGSGNVIALNAGIYTLSSGIDFSGASNVTFRGAGPDQTTVRFSGAASCGGLYGDICVKDINGYAAAGWIPPDNTAAWTAGYAKGTTQITLSQTTGLSVGSIIVLDQDNDTADTGSVFVCDSLDCSEEGLSPGRNLNGIDRNQQQYVRVTAIAGNVVTITPGLYMPNWSASKDPGAWWPGTTAEGIGIENMTLDHTPSCSGQPCVGIYFYNAHNSWVKNVKSLNPNRNHVWLYQSSHIQVQDSYFYGTKGGTSQSYGVESFMSGDNLVINNIFQHVTSPIMTGPASGSVFAYNFMVDMHYTTPSSWMQASINGGHDAGTALNLFEGNEGTQFTQDNYHGTGNFATVFRNQFTGSEPESEPEKTDNTQVISLLAYNRFANFVGNVLGTAGTHTTYTDDASAPTGTPNASIYLLGFGGVLENNNPPTGIPNDPLVKTTLLRWGNYDTKTGAPRWNHSEVPSGLSQFANPVPSNQILPASFFLTARPAWWGTMPWPAIGPDVSGGEDATGRVYRNPAHRYYDATDKVDGILCPYTVAACQPQ